MSGISWKKGYRAYGDAEKCYQELERIKKEQGHITAQAVMERAKEPKNPMHKDVFNCDEKEASERYYLANARKLIASIEIVRPEIPDKPSRAYEITTSYQKASPMPMRVYKTTEEILTDPIARRELLGQAIKDFHMWKRRYAMLSELAKVFIAVEDLDLTS